MCTLLRVVFLCFILGVDVCLLNEMWDCIISNVLTVLIIFCRLYSWKLSTKLSDVLILFFPIFWVSLIRIGTWTFFFNEKLVFFLIHSNILCLLLVSSTIFSHPSSTFLLYLKTLNFFWVSKSHATLRTIDFHIKFDDYASFQISIANFHSIAHIDTLLFS